MVSDNPTLSAICACNQLKYNIYIFKDFIIPLFVTYYEIEVLSYRRPRQEIRQD